MVNRKLFFVMLFIFAVGLCSGSFFEAYMQGEGKEQLKELISVFFSSEESPAFAVAFLSSVKKWLLLSAVLHHNQSHVLHPFRIQSVHNC